MSKDKSMYNSGDYSLKNPSWHKEDAKWKAQKIIILMNDDFLKKLKPEVDLIDIGCGTAEILKRVFEYLKIKNIAVNPIGYDISSEIIGRAKDNFPQADFRCTYFDAKNYKENKNRISVALLIDILEHMEDPAAFLQKIREVCDYAICHLPLEDNFEVNIRGLKKHFTDTVGHLNFYNKNSALDLFNDCGFNIKNMILTCSDVSADYKLKSLPRRLIAQPLRKVFFKFFPQFTARFLGNCSLMVLLEPASKGNQYL
ncbi:MAG: class I SAM-dependent methyltransferase [Candidatus Omnitrophota bacterium]